MKSELQWVKIFEKHFTDEGACFYTETTIIYGIQNTTTGKFEKVFITETIDDYYRNKLDYEYEVSFLDKPFLNKDFKTMNAAIEYFNKNWIDES